MKSARWWVDNRGVLILIISGTLLVTLLYTKGRVPLEAPRQKVHHVLRTMSLLDSTLNQDILRTRHGLLNHYDSVTDIFERMRQYHLTLRDDLLREAISHSNQVSESFQDQDRWLEAKAILLETYKTENSLLRNSIQYLPFATEALIKDADRQRRYEIASLLGEMARGILRYQVTPTDELKYALEALVGRLRNAAVNVQPEFNRDVAMVLSHVNIVLQKHKSIDSTFMRVVDNYQTPFDNVQHAYDAYYENKMRRHYNYQMALYAAAVFFIGYAAIFTVKYAKSATKAAKLFQAVEQSPNAVIIADSRGKIEYVNQSFTTISGYTAADVVGAMPLKQGSRLDMPPVITFLWGVMHGTTPIHGVIDSRRKEGASYWAEVSVAPINNPRGTTTHMLCIHSDVTEPKRVHDALRESETRYRLLFEYANDAIYLVDPNNRQVMDCNKKATDHTGFTREHLQALTIDELFQTTPPTQMAPLFDATIDELSVEAKENLYQRHVDGHLIAVEAHTARIELDGYVLVLAIVRDVTERKEAEQQLRRHRDHLEELVAERTKELAASNKELQAFTYSASHDLRAPLRAVSGFCEALEQDCRDKLDTRAMQYLGNIQRASRKMEQLIDDLMALSRVTRAELQKQDVDFTALAQEVAANIQLSTPERNVRWNIANPCQANGDPRLLTIVLDNLFANAWKFTRDQSEPVIEFGQLYTGGTTVYYVRDNGAGFNMAYEHKLFGVFQRLHSEREFEGTGIGLSIVQRIIHRHGGRIWAHGSEQEGATFFFTLMADDEVASAVTQAA